MNKVFYNPSNKISVLTYIESVFLKSCAKVLSKSDRLRVYSYHVLDKIVHDIKNNIKFKNFDLTYVTIPIDSYLYQTIYDNTILQNKISRSPTPDECTVCWSWYSTFSYQSITFKRSWLCGVHQPRSFLFTAAGKTLNLMSDT